MIRIVTLNANRSEYDIRDAADCSMTVGELIDELKRNYNEDDKIVFSNDNGYTYGYVTAGYIDEHNVKSREEEDLEDKMDELASDLDDLQEEFLNQDEDSPMTKEEYEERRADLFSEYGVSEQEYLRYMDSQ
ncbi:MAG: hypothetical protein J6X18_08450 [Bacteroidales bacterium]|nr:hypothetical protein [Bacteroidales bacterium]